MACRLTVRAGEFLGTGRATAGVYSGTGVSAAAAWNHKRRRRAARMPGGPDKPRSILSTMSSSRFRREVLEQENAVAKARAISEFGGETVPQLATTLLHKSWHPTTPDTAFPLYWREADGRSVVAFTEEGDVMESLFVVTKEAIEQVEDLINRIVPEGDKAETR